MRDDASWTAAELRDLAGSHSLQLTAGSDGDRSVELGMVVVDGRLYVRSFRGPTSRWYSAAVDQGHGRVACGPWTRRVTFSAIGDEITGLESAYGSKYDDAAALVESAHARAATLLISPR